jgi:hypothetical protein
MSTTTTTTQTSYKPSFPVVLVNVYNQIKALNIADNLTDGTLKQFESLLNSIITDDIEAITLRNFIKFQARADKIKMTDYYISMKMTHMLLLADNVTIAHIFGVKKLITINWDKNTNSYVLSLYDGSNDTNPSTRGAHMSRGRHMSRGGYMPRIPSDSVQSHQSARGGRNLHTFSGETSIDINQSPVTRIATRGDTDSNHSSATRNAARGGTDDSHSPVARNATRGDTDSNHSSVTRNAARGGTDDSHSPVARNATRGGRYVNEETSATRTATRGGRYVNEETSATRNATRGGRYVNEETHATRNVARGGRHLHGDTSTPMTRNATRGSRPFRGNAAHRGNIPRDIMTSSDINDAINSVYDEDDGDSVPSVNTAAKAEIDPASTDINTTEDS